MAAKYIHLCEDWSAFRWNETVLAPRLAATRHAQGRLLGRMEGLGFRLRGEADLAVMTAEVAKSSAIEGERLNDREVRSSLARRLGTAGAGKSAFRGPPEAARLPAETKRFLRWFNTEPRTDPVVKAALAHFWFVTIHPFEDGNGRIARAIADMALARSDGTEQRFYSMSAQIEAERRDYYAVLEQSQKGDLDITDWLTWFLACLGRSFDRAESAMSVVLRKARVWQRIGSTGVNERQRKVLNSLLDGFEGKLTSSKYAKLARCSSDTALRDIRDLLERGVFLPNPGGGRSVSYRLAEPENEA